MFLRKIARISLSNLCLFLSGVLPSTPAEGFLLWWGRNKDERGDGEEDDLVEVREKSSRLLSRSERFFLSRLSESLIIDCRDMDDGAGDCGER